MSEAAKRAIVVVLDGCGAGAAPDAAEFGDVPGAHTLLHTVESVETIEAPLLARCGFLASAGLTPSSDARYGRLRPIGRGKDSVTGHWEMMGVVVEEPFPLYPRGFPQDLLQRIEAHIGRPFLGNKMASGTEIIQELGPEHLRTRRPIIYTSADSVMQIACHESVAPPQELYHICRQARDECRPPNHVQRVIARPFVGSKSSGFRRTEGRRDFPVLPPPTLADKLGHVFGVGVVAELFAGHGFRAVRRTQSNAEHEHLLWEALESDASFIFANFEDFDMLFGHRNDPSGFAMALERFDHTLAELQTKLRAGDLLILTADHGNDPTDPSTDHTREYVPVALIGPEVGPAELGNVDGLTAIGATVAAHLGVDWPTGTNLLAEQTG